jgi:GrpB-like predicted nucleotidyltransferase (UPF0157 family)
MTAEQRDCPEAAMSDSAIGQASVGDAERPAVVIEIREYDPDWPVQFEAQAAAVRRALGAVALAVEHAGSTSVPGLAAKPALDIVLAVADSAAEASYAPPLETLGYELRIREPEWFEHRMFKLTAPATNLHVFSAGCPEIDRMLRFRDWLRANAEDRMKYEAVKRRLAAQSWRYVQNYADAKNEVVAEIMARAGRLGRVSST